MEITSIKLIKLTDTYNHVKAIASVIIDNALCINNIKVIETREKTFLSFPSRKMPNEKIQDIVYPINAEARAILTDAILDEYRKGN